MKIAGDTHTHTVACGHAMGTITENLAWAGRRGLRFMASTEHCEAITGSPPTWFFNNLMRMPREIDGVVLIYGVETNIIDIDGTVDMSQDYLQRLDWVVASAHMEQIDREGRTYEDYTNMYCALAENPFVDVIGHSGDPRFAHDCKRAVLAYRDHDKIVEINASSPISRKGSEPICREIALLCKEHGVKVVVSSDAHCPQHVGAVERGLALLEEIDFPEELVVNADYGRFCGELYRRRGLLLPE